MNIKKTSLKSIVIGSGPSGIAAAKALLSNGARVLMLDVGHKLEPDRESVVQKMGRMEPHEWDIKSLNYIRGNAEVSVSGLPKKLVYGSEYAYSDPYNKLRLTQRGTELFTSQAVGGLSNVWGSNIFPLVADDMHDWPIKSDDLSYFYKLALELMPYSAKQDGLTSLLPLYADRFHELSISSQGKAILAKLEQNQARLVRKGVTFGQSRLAVNALNCRYCGMCLYGCPYNLIYSSAYSLGDMLKNDNFEYLSGYFIEDIEENGDSVNVNAMHLDSNIKHGFNADRVFLASGAVGSAKILLRSLGLFDRPIEFKDSQYFLSPMLRWASDSNVLKEKLHTLSQIALLVRDKDISDKSIELLIYTYNDMFEKALSKIIPFSLLRGFILSRVFVIQGYLPSEQSDSLLMSLSEDGRLDMIAQINPVRKAAMRKVNAKLASLQNCLGASFLKPFMQVGAPGKSYHIGSSFPMKGKPAEFDSDTLGRISAFKRVHLVDASCLPSIPSTNTTLTVMANSMRISTLATKL
jgi:choline dehydrogenase-like flavoprotein